MVFEGLLDSSASKEKMLLRYKHTLHTDNSPPPQPKHTHTHTHTHAYTPHIHTNIRSVKVGLVLSSIPFVFRQKLQTIPWTVFA